MPSNCFRTQSSGIAEALSSVDGGGRRPHTFYEVIHFARFLYICYPADVWRPATSFKDYTLGYAIRLTCGSRFFDTRMFREPVAKRTYSCLKTSPFIAGCGC